MLLIGLTTRNIKASSNILYELFEIYHKDHEDLEISKSQYKIIMDHERLGQHKKNRRTEFLVKWENNQEVLEERDTDL